MVLISALLVAEQATGFMAGVSDCGSDALAISQMKQLNATVSRRSSLTPPVRLVEERGA